MAAMSTYAIATQVVGFAGYGLLLGATLARRRLALLAIDASGGVVLVIHWAMLGALAGVTMNALYTAIDVAGVDPHSRRGRLVLASAVPATAVLVVAFWQGPADLLAAAGVLFAIASRASRSQVNLRALAMMGCIPWGLFGIVNGSIPQIIFSAVYFVAMGVSIMRIRRGWGDATPPGETAILPADGSR
jgi:hypothetical protein